MEYLIELGCDVNLGTHDLFTPLFGAAEKGAIDCLKVLIANQAEIDAKRPSLSTPLATACYFGQMVYMHELSTLILLSLPLYPLPLLYKVILGSILHLSLLFTNIYIYNHNLYAYMSYRKR